VNKQGSIDFEGRLKLFHDVLSHRDQMIHNIELYPNQHFEEYQEHVSTEMEYMRASLSNTSTMLNEQSQALVEAHLNDEGSTMRIIELGRCGELAEQGTAHIIQESIAMTERYHSELESTSSSTNEAD
jgi:excinuclease UvrABC helicase subunit UvrB